MRLEVVIMSGVEDGLRLTYSQDNGDGEVIESAQAWRLSIGRRDESDICLRHDTFVSRKHAYIRWEQARWWLEDGESTNGTYVDLNDTEARITGTIPLEPGQLFRVGHTWLRIEDTGY